MRYFKHLLYLLLLLFIISPPVFAQTFGKIVESELKKTVYEEAKEADAVKLLEVGEITVTPRFQVESKRHIRIKILTEKGKDKANMIISWAKGEKINDLKAHTVLPSGEKIEVKKEHKQEIKQDDYRLLKIAFPGVEIGSIIELQFKKFSNNFIGLEPWYFQSDMYTKLSKITVTAPPFFNYSYIYKDLRHISSIPETVTDKNYSIYRWKGEDIEPIDLTVPYSLNPRNYLSCIYFILSEFFDGFRTIKITRPWTDHINSMWKHYKSALNLKKEIKKTAQQLTRNKASEEEIIRALYDFVRTKIDPDNLRQNSPYVFSANDVLKKGKGTENEKNVLLIALLRAADINAVPVLIADRTRIRTMPDIVRFDNFNAIICSAPLSSGKEILLDASSKYYPLSLLPYLDLVSYGLYIKKDGDLKELSYQTNQGNTISEIDAVLSEEGVLRGKLTLEYSGYSAAVQRKKVDDAESHIDYMQNKLKEKFPDFTLSAVNISNQENVYEPLKAEADFTINNFAQNIGNKLLICPSILQYMSSNTFKKEERMIPIEFIYPSINTEKVTISLPEKFKVEEIPEGRNYSVSDIAYKNNCSYENGKVIYSREYNVSDIIINKGYYSRVKSLFDNIVSLDKNLIIISNEPSQ